MHFAHFHLQLNFFFSCFFFDAFVPVVLKCIASFRYCEDHNIKESTLDLSMGMSHDFETAIKQGSTSVRVGSLIFGARNYGGI